MDRNSDFVPGSKSRLTIVDHKETYGRHILKKIIEDINIQECLDIGCGAGDDLLIVKKRYPNSKLYGIDFDEWNKEILNIKGIEQISVNLEDKPLPFEDNSLDLIIGNQIMEHTKEIFWINQEIFRCLKVGGVFFMGVPNVLSLHNRILMLFGGHPTCNKSVSAHVRVFSKRDVKQFYNVIGGDSCKVERFYGAQFYPFPKGIARVLANTFPSLAFSSFYVIRKTGEFSTEFIDWPKKANLETNFFVGNQSIV